MRPVRTSILWSDTTIGGSLSRPRNELYREAADLAYHFHWSRNDVLGMTSSERRQWLFEIHRIHGEEHRQRQKEVIAQAMEIAQLRKTMEE